MSDIRGYTGIAERTDPVVLAGQLDAHRREMAVAIRDAGGTIVQYAGDAVLAVFGAPAPLVGHERLACQAAAAMHARQRALDDVWAARGFEPFGLGIGVATGVVAAAVLGSDDHLEYSVVGDTVNLAQRLQTMARRPGTTVVSAATAAAAGLSGAGVVELAPTTVKGRVGLVRAFRLQDPGTRASSPAVRAGTPPVSAGDLSGASRRPRSSTPVACSGAGRGPAHQPAHQPDRLIGGRRETPDPEVPPRRRSALAPR
ncbi:adenylate/guanylate cyclase domain-containing protein [Frankia sp. CNm7]|uniref:Adenylate/guanylate cyclase domain-containing protein n=2 Tax=Frankia nepalensis TaxID=1836974 RepID=A0A937RHW0_9ACTN|nr:adenylate/guanylate cyclase domain-containing protein [Frankia nepalensis]MBL7511702.1 adenylate/guanylate cyclase domain-containing protein [Frankia nepalensis]MBL7523029.1 adenylate/guanylate cyclase domain-containing protein [Frankia nepalensis]MBL7632538.1 adenylate/guanylate cyclase domain-containing protein [Frankia nepalensis]